MRKKEREQKDDALVLLLPGRMEKKPINCIYETVGNYLRKDSLLAMFFIDIRW